MSYPPQMMAMAKRLVNFNSTIKRFDAKNRSGPFKPTETVGTTLPENALLDPRTLKMFYKVTTKSTNNSVGYVAAPPAIGLIDQVVTVANNKEVERTISGYGRYCLMRDDYEAGCEVRAARKLLSGECLPHLNQSTGDFYGHNHGHGSDGAGDALSTVTALYDGYRDNERQMCIDVFPHCFLGTATPCVISTSATGRINLEFRLAPADVLTSVGVAGHARANPDGSYANDALPAPEAIELDTTVAAALAEAVATPTKPINPTYEITDVYFTCKALNIQDGKFFDWMKSQITDSTPWEIPFTHVWAETGPLTQNGSLNCSTRCTIQSSSADMAFLTLIPDDANSGQLVPGQNNIYATAKARGNSFVGGTYGNLQLPRYFQHGCIDGSKEFQSVLSQGGTDLNEPADLPMIWSDLKEELNIGKSAMTGLNPRLTNMANFRKSFFVHPVRLNWKSTDTGKDSPNYLSGFNTRNDSSTFLWKLKGSTEKDAAGATVNVTPVIYVSTTAVARLLPNQRIEVRP